jgi:exonuclease III
MRLKGATFNLEYGRDRMVVKHEVEHLIDKQDLDFVVVQEAADYTDQLDNIAGYQYFVNHGNDDSARQVGILVRDSLHTDRVAMRNLGDGWTTIAGPHHGALAIPTVRIEKWLKVTGLHAPTPTEWVRGVLRGPVERVDDYKALARFLVAYFRPPVRKTARLAVGDWNENPETKGRYAPKWIASVSGAKIVAPSQLQGHGRIDYPMFKGCKITHITKDLTIREGSDHEPVIFTVVKT